AGRRLPGKPPAPPASGELERLRGAQAVARSPPPGTRARAGPSRPADGHRRPRRRRPRPAHYAHHPARGGRPDTQTWSTQSYATGPTGEWTILLRARRGGKSCDAVRTVALLALSADGIVVSCD